MNFDLRELEKITMRIIRVPERLNEALERETSVQVNALLSNSAKDLAPMDTGNLRQQIDTDGFAYRTKDGVTMGITSHAHYSIYVEYGTGELGDDTVPHTDRKSWVYKDEDGKWRVGKPHPPNPYMRTALAQNVEPIRDIIAGKAKEVIEYD